MFPFRPWNAIIDTWTSWTYPGGEQSEEGDYTAELAATEPLRPVRLKLERVVSSLQGIDIRSQGSFGTCVANTVDHLIRFYYWRTLEANIYISRHWVYSHRTTRNQGLDAGMSTIATLNRTPQHKLLPEDAVPYPKKKKDLRYKPSQFPDPIRRIIDMECPWRGATFVELDRSWKKLENTLSYDYRLHGIRAHALSIYGSSGWWSGDDVPRWSGPNGTGHAVVVLNAPVEFQGKTAFIVLDSAYHPGRVWRWYRGVRVLTPAYEKGLYYLSLVQWRDLSEPLPLIMQTARYGEKGHHVRTIQKALRALGYPVPATGYYGPKTQAAVLMFFADHRKDYELRGVSWEDLQRNAGKYFGKVSIEVYKARYL